jgi:hypothetical protein
MIDLQTMDALQDPRGMPAAGGPPHLHCAFLSRRSTPRTVAIDGAANSADSVSSLGRLFRPGRSPAAGG